MLLSSVRREGDAELKTVATGGIAGLLATLIMSVCMLAADFLGWMNEQPPTTITSRVAHKAGMPVSGASLDIASGFAHLGFGMVGGSAFGLIARRLPSLPASAALGVVYGLLIWITSYVAILPSLDLMPGPAEGERRRTPVMVFAHIVYGAVLGILEYAMERPGSSPRP
jgi:uncharacterized membrane protein YagU involved in acid resistance